MSKLCYVLTIFLLSVSGVSLAYDYEYLTFSDDAGQTSFSLGQIERITFSPDNMNVELADGTLRSIPLASLSRMFFSDSNLTTMIDDAATGTSIKMGDGVLRVSLTPGERVTIYNIKGLQVLTSVESLTLDLDHLPKGVYIVKVGSLTKKFLNN